MGLIENKQLVRDFYEAGNHGDIEHCLAMLADDVTWTNLGSTRYSGRFEGKDVLLSEVIGPLFGQLKAGIFSTIDNLVAEDDVVVAQTRGQAEMKDGRPYNNSYCHVFRIRDGRIVEVTEYLDTQLVREVLG